MVMVVLKFKQLAAFVLQAEFELVVVSTLLVVNHLLVSLLVRLPWVAIELLGLWLLLGVSIRELMDELTPHTIRAISISAELLA